jgi:hypothetical protein
MARSCLAWGCVVGFALLAACGGDPFVLSDASAIGVSGDGSSEAAPITSDVFCANQTCTGTRSPGSVRCCTSVASPTSSNCRTSPCTGCDTELLCASDADCTSPMPVCCIESVPPSLTCLNGHYAARCQAACGNGSRLCIPNTRTCPGSARCSMSSADLQSVGLPVALSTSMSYGVCP